MGKFAIALLRIASVHSHAFNLRGHTAAYLLFSTLAARESRYDVASFEDGEVGASKHSVLSDISMGALETRNSTQKISRRLKADKIDALEKDFTGTEGSLHVEISTVKSKTRAKGRSKASGKGKASEKAEEKANVNAQVSNLIVAGEKATELTEIRVEKAEKCSTEIGVVNTEEVTVYENEQAEQNAEKGNAEGTARHGIANVNIVQVHDDILNYAANIELHTYKCGRLWEETAYKLLDYGIPFSHVIKMVQKCKNLACTKNCADSAIQHFSMLGMSLDEMGRAIAQWPTMLNITGTMFQRKVEFFESAGIDRRTLSKMICLVPMVITFSFVALRKYWDFWNQYMQDIQANAISVMIVNNPKLLSYGLHETVMPKIAYFEEQGYDKKILLKYSAILSMSLESFASKNKLLEQFGMSSPKKRCWGIAVLRGIGRAGLLMRFSTLFASGFSLDQVQDIISKCPQVLCLSDDHINVKLSYAINVMNLSLDELVACPAYWTHSFEKRIKYRYEVIKQLQTLGVVKKEVSPGYMVCMADGYFTKKFVERLQDCVNHPDAPIV